MIVWRITGNVIGPNDCGAHYFAKKKDAEKALREYRAWRRENGAHDDAVGPEKIEIKDRYDLAEELNSAMGYGGS
jgi:hypothetical protein